MPQTKQEQSHALSSCKLCFLGMQVTELDPWKCRPKLVMLIIYTLDSEIQKTWLDLNPSLMLTSCKTFHVCWTSLTLIFSSMESIIELSELHGLQGG